MKNRFNYDTSNKTIKELISLQNKCVVVVGGAKGIGFAIAERLAEAGASVIIADQNPINAELASQRISGKYGLEVSSFPLDPVNPHSVADLINYAIQYKGGIDIWINHAGIYPCQQVLDLTEEDVDKVIEKNLKGCFIGCREAGKQMRAAQKGGVIINITPSTDMNLKQGITSLTRAFASRLGPEGIRVMAVSSSAIETAESNGLNAGDNGWAENKLAIPLGRLAIPDDIARAVLFCASDLSMFITGSILNVDGGQTNHWAAES